MTDRRWAFVDALDDDGNLAGNLVIIEQKPRPFGGPGSWGERKRRQRVTFRITIKALADDLGMTPVEVSAIEVGEVEADAMLRSRWNDALMARGIAIVTEDTDAS